MPREAAHPPPQRTLLLAGPRYGLVAQLERLGHNVILRQPPFDPDVISHLGEKPFAICCRIGSRVVSEMTDRGAGPRWFFANLAEVKLTRQASGDGMSIVEISCPPGDMPPLHVHRTDDEAWVVLDGEVSFFAGSNEPVRVAAGGVAFGPRGVAHTYRVESDGPARMLAICTSGDFAAFVIAASQPADRAELPPPPPGPPTEAEVAAVAALAAEHGIELLGPPGALPGDAPAH